ncbi:hypothetical protein ES707_11663 [subsurface metagenome]
MSTTYLYRKPASGETRPHLTVGEAEAAGQLAMTRAQAEDSLTVKLLDAEARLAETQWSIDAATGLYTAALNDPGRKTIHEVKKPISLVLVGILFYLVIT